MIEIFLETKKIEPKILFQTNVNVSKLGSHHFVLISIYSSFCIIALFPC